MARPAGSTSTSSSTASAPPTARARGRADALRADLPGAPPARPRASAPRRRGHEWGGFLQVNALLLAIWAVSGAGYFWPAWVMVWWAFALVMKSVRAARRAEQQRIERM